MPNNYNITVKNKSGSLQQYALFNKVPIVSGKVQEQVWSNISTSTLAGFVPS